MQQQQNQDLKNIEINIIYLNKYNTRILTFQSDGVPLFNEDTTRMLFLDSILQFQSQPTEINDLFAAQPGNRIFRYLFKKTIQSGNTVLGYFYVIINANRYKSEALYPELFNQVADPLTDPSSGYAYAVYQKGKLMYDFSKYDFSSEIDLLFTVSFVIDLLCRSHRNLRLLHTHTHRAHSQNV